MKPVDITQGMRSKWSVALHNSWERVDDGSWNRLRLDSMGVEAELAIKRVGSGYNYRITLCGRLLGETRDRDEMRRRVKAVALLRAWIVSVHEVLAAVSS